MDHSRPERFGRYRVIDVLGEGGMGVVYAAVDERLGRPVALKVLRAAFAADSSSRERFWREAQLAARINHPRVCQLHDVGDQDGQLFLVMERLEGESLAHRLKRGPLPIGDTIPIVLEILVALDVLHKHGIVHRDLKPSNVFLTPHGAKVLDFGVAKLDVGPASDTKLRLTEIGAAVGTPRYMAPEQALGHPAGPSADLFAVGAILYEMFTGVPAFNGRTASAILDQIAHEDVAVLAGSPAIAVADRVIHRALSKSPTNRYRDAAAMAEDLRLAALADSAIGGQYARQITRVTVMPLRLLRPDPEIEFVCFSLADAVATTLASLDTLVIRSPLAARQMTTDTLDLASIAGDGGVDVVLTGTVLRAIDVVRITSQLLEAPSGKILWSHTTRRPAQDLFQTEDAIVREIVESLLPSLAERGHAPIRPDVPSNAKAYEFYLRANALSRDSKSWTIARDLYLQALEADASYAPAWARLGRVYRLLSKFESPMGYPSSIKRRNEQTALAESAFNRALALNPNLAIAESYYAQLELDLGRAEEAMARLVRQAMTRSTDADLFAALVSACRYCGLLTASLSAANRARRLDPNVRTSVTHTYFMAGDYLKAAEESERRWQTGNLGGFALLAANHPDAHARLAIEAARYGGADDIAAFLDGDFPKARAAADKILSTFPDPEYHFYMGLFFSHIGFYDRALEVLAGAVGRGFFPLSTLQRHHWLDPVRGRADFNEIVERAEQRHRAAVAAFVAAGGPSVLGVLAGDIDRSGQRNPKRAD